ncbi:MAG: 2-oxoacid:acceptor oxidoreductase subunit alpha [Phycisphaerae bacterium]|nr:2-oxoacid:acceptor oxidoreductase subunit alpha [Phycisphaerae bacterium]
MSVNAQSSQVKISEALESAVVRFAGDSGDGMQLVGTQFTASTALLGNDLATLPDFPAEIRAPASTLAGVSGFQINFSSHDIYTPGDAVQALVAMNAAALKVNLPDLEPGGIIVANSDGFTAHTLKLAGYEKNPLEDNSLAGYRVFSVPITMLTRQAVEPTGLKPKDAERCKNFFALGLVFWLYERDMTPTLHWLEDKFGKRPEIGEANALALKAGFNFGVTTEIFPAHYHIGPAKRTPGTYRKIRGTDAISLGLTAAAERAGKKLFYASYPITPASDILHELVKYKNFGVKVFQAEDEIAAMCAAIGAAYGGDFAATGTSGPGMDLKAEALGLAVILELPCVVVNMQRGGPSTGLPTKSEQADLLQAIWGRHGECPVPVLAAKSPSDCFWTAIEAFQIAVKYMTPVILLADGYLGNSAEPWKVPKVEELPIIPVTHLADPEGFQPYSRNDDLARPWAIPGTPGMAHRIGGLEKQHLTGAVSYDFKNHEFMVRLRAEKVAKVAASIPPQPVFGADSGDLLVVSWGSTFGTVHTAVDIAQKRGLRVGHAHLRHLFPFPNDLGEILKRYQTVLVPELNLGQLRMLLRATYLVDAIALTKVQGRPFTIREVLHEIERLTKEG